jgi:hypothetical protein
MSEQSLQFFDVSAPKRGNGFQLTLDTTVRVYDIGSLAWGGKSFDKTFANQYVFLRLHADGCDVYYRFYEATTDDMVETTYISAGGTVSLQNAYAEKLPSGQSIEIRINRLYDRYLSVKGSAAGTLRVTGSSPPNP